MTRKKVKLAYITNDTARKATFKKRKRGLLKKVSELSTLCGIEACAIIFSPFSSHPEVWPSALGVQRVLTQFRNMPEMEQSKKMVNQETFLRQRICKASEQLKKHQRDNREKEMTRVMFQSLVGLAPQGLNMIDLNDLGWLIDQNVADICKRMESLRKEALNQAPYVPMAPAMGADGFNQRNDVVQMAAGKQGFAPAAMDGAQMEPWFMDMVSSSHDMGFNIADDVILPFGDENHTAFWSNSFFP